MSNETTNVGFYGISFGDEKKNKIKNTDKGRYAENLEVEKIKELFDKNGAFKIEPNENTKSDFEAYVKGMQAREEAEKARAEKAKAALMKAMKKAKEEQAKDNR